MCRCRMHTPGCAGEYSGPGVFAGRRGRGRTFGCRCRTARGVHDGAFAAARSRLIECHDANRAAQDPLPPPFTRIPCAPASSVYPLTRICVCGGTKCGSRALTAIRERYSSLHLWQSTSTYGRSASVHMCRLYTTTRHTRVHITMAPCRLSTPLIRARTAVRPGRSRGAPPAAYSPACSVQ